MHATKEYQIQESNTSIVSRKNDADWHLINNSLRINSLDAFSSIKIIGYLCGHTHANAIISVLSADISKYNFEDRNIFSNDLSDFDESTLDIIIAYPTSGGNGGIGGEIDYFWDEDWWV